MLTEEQKRVLVPFSGFLSFYQDPETVEYNSTGFSSPFRGFYLSTEIPCSVKGKDGFSSPFRGFYLSTRKAEIKVDGFVFSSPFRGFYLSTKYIIRLRFKKEVLVPFSGFLSFYSYRRCNKISSSCSRPLFGVSIFLRQK